MRKRVDSDQEYTHAHAYVQDIIQYNNNRRKHIDAAAAAVGRIKPFSGRTSACGECCTARVYASCSTGSDCGDGRAGGVARADGGRRT